VSIFDLRSRWSRAILNWGGLVDPASYTAVHSDSTTTTGTLSFQPDSSRGPFLGWGIQRSDDATVSRMVLSVEARRLTPTPIAWNALCHLRFFSGEGIDLSAWPAPLLIEQAQAATLQEQVIDSGDSLAGIAYALVGFHTDLESYVRVSRELGEFRGWSIEVAPAAAVAGGQASNQYTMTENTNVVEYVQSIYSDPGTTPLDMLRVRLDDKDILYGERASNVSVGVSGPVRLGIPAAFLGIDTRPGNTFKVAERIGASTRRDAFSFLGIAR